MKIYAKLLCGTALAVSMLGSASAANLDKVGISVGSLGNPFFVATIKGITDKAKSINPNVQVISVSSDYDLNKQATQIDNFIAAGVNVIMLNAVDAKAIAPAVERAHKAGIVVAAFDVGAQGADVTVMTDNVKAGTLACQYIVDHLPGGKGDVLIVNGPQVTSVVDRVKGCKEVFAKNAGIKVLSSDQDAKGSRDGGMAVTQSLLTANPKIDAIFAINDPTGIGVGARRQADAPRRILHHRGRRRARHRGGTEDRQVDDQGVVVAGSLHDGGHGARTRRKDAQGREDREAGRAARPGAHHQ